MAKSPYDELPEVLKDHLPPMFASYPRLCKSTPSSWFAWTNGRVLAYNAAICHALMSDATPGLDEMITAVPKSDDLSLEYLRMLVRGPFRSMSDLIKLDKLGSNYFLHLTSLDKWPANVLMNFCIASRIPIEFHYLLSSWSERCEKGFNPTLAWLLTYSYGTKYGTETQFAERTFDMARPGHMWLDPSSDWKNLLCGTFVEVSKPYKTHPYDIRPTNSIWGHCNDYQQLCKMTDEQIAEFYSTPIQVLELLPVPMPKAIKKPLGPIQGQPMFYNPFEIQLPPVIAPHANPNHINNFQAVLINDGPNWVILNAEPQPQPEGELENDEDWNFEEDDD